MKQNKKGFLSLVHLMSRKRTKGWNISKGQMKTTKGCNMGSKGVCLFKQTLRID